MFQALKTSVPAAVFDDVASAVSVAASAVEAGDLDEAVVYLEWAKATASRSYAVREALGVVRYLQGDFGKAAAELGAYRRLSGAEDQNHLLADCARAAGDTERVERLVRAMEESGVDPARVAEGHIVLAGSRADAGDLDAALETLERTGLSPARAEPYHARVWVYAAELEERRGRRDRARELLEAVVALDPDDELAAERLAAIGDGTE